MTVSTINYSDYEGPSSVSGIQVNLYLLSEIPTSDNLFIINAVDWIDSKVGDIAFQKVYCDSLDIDSIGILKEDFPIARVYLGGSIVAESTKVSSKAHLYSLVAKAL